MKIKSIYSKMAMAALVSLMGAQHITAQDAGKLTSPKLELKMVQDTTSRQISALVTGVDATAKTVPVKGVTVDFYIKRDFGNIHIDGDEKMTDDSGKIAVQFPKNIPGDPEGNVTILAKVDEDDHVGTLNVARVINWGIPVKEDKTALSKRTLWAARSNAPISLIIFVNSMIALVWGTLIYILFQLFNIKKSGKHELQN